MNAPAPSPPRFLVDDETMNLRDFRTAATHRLDMLRKIAHTVTVLSRGVAVETLALTERQPTEARLIEHMTANIRVTPRPSHESLDPGPVAFELTDWTAYHPVNTSLAVVQGVSLHARRGEIVGLAGLEGSGLDEFALSLFGRTFSSHVTGEMQVNGHPLVANSPQESVAGGVGLSTAADIRYDLNLLGGIPSRISSSMLARLARLGLVDRDRDYRTASPAFGLGGISALAGGRAAGARRAVADGRAAGARRAGADGRAAQAGRTGSSFAGSPAADNDTAAWAPGPRRHLDALTQWLDLPLERRPIVVVLDHPTASLLGEQLHLLRDLVVELAAGGTAVLLASDDLDELLVMTNRIYTLAGGRITAETATRDATPQSLLASMIGPG